VGNEMAGYFVQKSTKTSQTSAHKLSFPSATLKISKLTFEDIMPLKTNTNSGTEWSGA
jgi:hypothetical protein